MLKFLMLFVAYSCFIKMLSISPFKAGFKSVNFYVKTKFLLYSCTDDKPISWYNKTAFRLLVMVHGVRVKCS